MRTELTLKICGIFEFETIGYGYPRCYETHRIYSMEDSTGKAYVWKTASVMGLDNGNEFAPIDKGDTVKITASVKGENVYKGKPQIVLQRVKVDGIIEKSKRMTREQWAAHKAEEQRNSLCAGDFIWYGMPYKQYKEHYNDCETVAGSYDRGTIDVIIRNGRLKNSGVRGQRFAGYVLKSDRGRKTSYRAVSEENALKRARKEFPGENWEVTEIYY